jgi:methylenetetrahydrofolate dehydrogenase (NADP+)/methenyltetrahydrofolate cyclohydrolase
MMQGKNVTIIGQSALVGMPLATSCMQRGASVYSFNQRSHPQDIQTSSKKSDYIMSATGVPHLITADHVRTDKSQILIDIGRSMVQGKATGDIDTHGVQELVYALTPVPGGVGPMTIASLFSNMKTLYEQHQQKKLS